MSDNRENILKGLAEIGFLGAKAEALSIDDLLRSTLPIQNHLHFLEPDILLILGGRGAGKSHLFRLINSPEGQEILSAGKRRLADAIWIKGFYTRESDATRPLYFPGETVLQRFAEGKAPTDLLDFWRGLLLGAILKQVDEPREHLLHSLLPDSLFRALSDLSHITNWHSEVVTHLEEVESALNRLDQDLANEDRFLFATYDDLDVMAVEWPEKRALIQSLLRFWLSQWRRWRRLRPKIFLRFDLFAPDFLQFPDASKLEGNKVEIHWKYVQLYQMVFKAWANRNQDSLIFLKRAGLDMQEDKRLGWTYSGPPPSEEILRSVVHRMMGQFMGSGRTKGRTFEWLPKHLQDANGEIVPRSILNLLALAAKDELDHYRAKGDFLLSPLSIRQVIEEVSDHRVRELSEEYPWLEIIRPQLEGQEVPMPRQRFTDLLQKIDWQSPPPTDRPISQKPSDIVDQLLKIGVLRLTSDGRIHVPDIYLYGFKMKRRGGIRRPQ